ncbi:MAG: hypothetical protein LBP94_03300 [Zoogloeaceae bacterium]|nr:hypothetical protein [Zoogloeaceae bacterium]
MENTATGARLANGGLGEEDFKNYYLVTSILISIWLYLGILAEPQESMFALALEAIGTVIITILGINAAFKANGGSAGAHFINKVVSISLPLFMKLLATGFVLGLILGFSVVLSLSKYQEEWVWAVASPLVQAIFFWRLVVHVRATNQPDDLQG